MVLCSLFSFLFVCFFIYFGSHLIQHAVPTRRSSDLVLLGAVLLGEGVATPAETWFLLAGAAITATAGVIALARDRKSTRLNSSHVKISYAVFCLKKKTII